MLKAAVYLVGVCARVQNKKHMKHYKYPFNSVVVFLDSGVKTLNSSGAPDRIVHTCKVMCSTMKSIIVYR